MHGIARTSDKPYFTNLINFVVVVTPLSFIDSICGNDNKNTLNKFHIIKNLKGQLYDSNY